MDGSRFRRVKDPLSLQRSDARLCCDWLLMRVLHLIELVPLKAVYEYMRHTQFDIETLK